MVSEDMQNTVENNPDHENHTDDPTYDLKNSERIYSLVSFDGVRYKFTIRFFL